MSVKLMDNVYALAENNQHIYYIYYIFFIFLIIIIIIFYSVGLKYGSQG